LKIKTLHIEDIAGISNLNLQFNENMNLICGPNGIGKTTILECIAHTFSASQTNILKRNSLSNKGNFSALVNIDNQDKSKTIEITDFIPNKGTQFTGLHESSIYLLSLKVNRTFNYKPLNSVSKDIDKNGSRYQEAQTGVNIDEVKNWFVNRHLYSKHENSLTDEQIFNLNYAKKIISVIDKDFSFSRVQASDNEIMINTPNGEIYYEYLSSGFKSIISILFGIIKDIEFRFKNPCIKANEFDGIILIDELELHLHPSWQSKISTILTQTFPKVQFIATTHSPHIIQNANTNEIIALERIDKEPKQRDLTNNEFGFQGWTIEEVLIDVMGMEDTRTNILHSTIENFEIAIEKENFVEAQKYYDILNKLLHPNNHLRKLLKFDLISIQDDN